MESSGRCIGADDDYPKGVYYFCKCGDIGMIAYGKYSSFLFITRAPYSN